MTAELQHDQITAPDLADPSGTKRSWLSWRLARMVGYVAYAAVWARVLIADGVPTDRLVIALLIVGGLAVTRIGRGWRSFAVVVRDWLPFTLVLIAYDKTRAVADALGLPVHVADVAHVERDLFGDWTGGEVPTVWLQHHLYDPATVHWYDVAATLVYSSHFLVTPILAAVLWLRSRQLWLGYITRVIVLSVAGLMTYCVFPQAPPWLAARDGVLEPVARTSARGWLSLHLGDVHHALAGAQRDGANPVAAMPSLHTGFAVLVALVATMHLRSSWRWLALLYPAAMGFALVYTGEHYVLDLAAGVVYAVLAYAAGTAIERRRARGAPIRSDAPVN